MKKVCIVGAGISGLSCAHELIRRGFSVNLYEISNDIGGKAKSGRSSSGYPYEHGFRIYSGYRNYFKILEEIKTDKNTPVIKNLTDVNFHLYFSKNDPTHYCVKRSLSRPLNTLHALYRTMQLVPFKEMYFYAKEIILFPFRSKKYHHYLENTDFSSFLKKASKKYSPEFERYVGEWTYAQWGMPPEKSSAYLTLNVLFAVHLRHFNFFKKELLFPVMNAPSSEALFTHWHKFLVEKGVNFHFNHALISIEKSGSKENVNACVFENNHLKNKIKADYYVLALPVEKVARLIPDVTPYIAELSEYTRPFNAVQLFLCGKYELPDGITRFEDSPWSIIACYQGESLWPNTPLNPPVNAVFSTIIANWEKPGILYHKPAIQCSSEEIVNELVAQIAQHKGIRLERMNVYESHFDNSIKFSDDKSEIVDIGDKLYSTGAGMYDKQPGVVTQLKNLFLAGDYISTDMHQGTMESACISGKMVANEILKQNGMSDMLCELVTPVSIKP